MAGRLPSLGVARLASRARRVAELSRCLAHAVRALGHPLLLGRQTTSRLLASAPCRRLLRFAGQAPLGLGQLTRLELQVPHRAAALVGPGALHLSRQFPELIDGLTA
ncbi:MAG TPA: hypothetical protein VMV01_07550, partial [Planctomycetota bacterium]|nr:hypothetical protein [Planctomycetota bacterium]